MRQFGVQAAANALLRTAMSSGSGRVLAGVKSRTEGGQWGPRCYLYTAPPGRSLPVEAPCSSSTLCSDNLSA